MELTPICEISINGASTFPTERVISIRTNDETGIVSDSCEIELDDYDDAIQMPNTEAKVAVSLGFKSIGLTKIGTYFVKEIFIDGARRTIKIRCGAGNKKMRSQRTKSNAGSLGDYTSTAASDFSLTPAIADDLRDVELDGAPQFAESDMHYLTRTAQKIGAVVKPVDGHLVLAKDMENQRVNGEKFPTKTLLMSDVSNYSCSFKETESEEGSGTTVAKWYDKERGEYENVTIGSGDPTTELNEIFGSHAAAKNAARAKLKSTLKNNRTLSVATNGRPDLFAENLIVLQVVISKKIPAQWIITKVEHNFSANGFNTNIKASEVQNV